MNFKIVLSFSQANVSRVITVPLAQPVENSTATINVPEQQVEEDISDKKMATNISENIHAFPTADGHTLSSPESNDVKRAKYDESVDMEGPSTSSHNVMPKNEETHMEVEEEPEIIEVSLSTRQFNPGLIDVQHKNFQIGERHAILFSLNSSQPISHEEEMKDSFFDLTVNDIKVLLRDLRTQSQDLENAPLKTSKMREMEHDNQTMLKLNRYRTTVIRIQFANRLVLQGIFLPSDTIQQVMDFVRSFLNDTNLEFHLCKTQLFQELLSVIYEFDFYFRYYSTENCFG